MGTRKYFGDTNGDYPSDQQLYWPGTADGFPVLVQKNQAINLKQEELDNIDYRLDFKSKMFELWEPQQKAEFDDINDRIVNNLYSLRRREDHWDNEHKHYRVWMEWCQVYGTLPQK